MTALVVASLTLREVARRRAVVALLLGMPLCFYLARRELPGQSTRFLAMGIGWAVSTLTLFVVNGSRRVDPRLRLTGASLPSLVGGRLLAMTGAGVVLASAYWVLVELDQDVRRPWAIGPMLILPALVGAPLGSFIGGLLPRELEGALTLLTISAVQMIANPEGTLARFMPFWSSREIASYAIDGTGSGDAWRALLHAGVTLLLATLAALALSARRLSVARYPEP